MKYLIQQEFSKEIPAREQYIYDVFHLWIIPFRIENKFIFLNSIPSHALDNFLFIIGHNYDVAYFLKSHNIREDIIVAITCDGTVNFSKKYLPHKKLFLPFQNNNNCAALLNGSLYGFDFDLTESELLLYNNNHIPNINERIENAFKHY